MLHIAVDPYADSFAAGVREDPRRCEGWAALRTYWTSVRAWLSTIAALDAVAMEVVRHVTTSSRQWAPLLQSHDLGAALGPAFFKQPADVLHSA